MTLIDRKLKLFASGLCGLWVSLGWQVAPGPAMTVTPADPSVPSLRIGVFNASALIRANVKAMIEYQRDFREGDNHSLNALLRFAF